MTFIENVKKNRDLLFIALIVVIVAIITVISLTHENTPSSYDQFESPFSTHAPSSDRWGTIDLTTARGVSKRTVLPVYTAEPYSVEDVFDIVVSFGMGDDAPLNSSDGNKYSWSRGANFATYNKRTGDFVVNSSAISLSENIDVPFTKPNVQNYFLKFVQVFLGSSTKISMNVQENSGSYDVTGTWQLEGYSVVLKNGQDYSVIARFNKNGSLESLYASLLTFSKEGSVVKIVPFDNLASYIQVNNYPKEAYVYNIASDQKCTDEACDPYGLDAVDTFQEAIIKDASLVYYFSQNSGSNVLPAYRLEGNGSSSDGTTLRNVFVVIYANAVDPSQILTANEE